MYVRYCAYLMHTYMHISVLFCFGSLCCYYYTIEWWFWLCGHGKKEEGIYIYSVDCFCFALPHLAFRPASLHFYTSFVFSKGLER